jgi:hypothetical protein
MVEIFAISAGCRESSPMRIQRWVSFTGRMKSTAMRRSVVTMTAVYTTAGWRSFR